VETGELIGEIVRLQVQRVPIKVKGESYLPEEILEVENASVDASGMLGWHDGAWVVDAHHKTHPSVRGGGTRTLSVGFTGHYNAMEERFGNVPLGVAGENFIVDGEPLWLDDLDGGIIVETAKGQLSLEGATVAAPCREFACFLLGRDDVAPRDEVADSLAFLNDGRRGFIVEIDEGIAAMKVALGDKVYHGV